MKIITLNIYIIKLSNGVVIHEHKSKL